MTDDSSEQLPAWNGRTFGRVLFQLGQLAHRDYLIAVRRHGLRDLDFPVLSYLSQHPGCSQQDIRADMGLDSGNLARIIERLHAAGFVERTGDPLDARRRLLSLTASGTRTYGEVRQDIARGEARLAGLLPDAQAEKLLTLLHHLLERMQERTKGR